jgi:hypothetical protein
MTMVAVKSRPKEREQLKLRLKVDEILARPAAPLQVSEPLPSAFDQETISEMEVTSEAAVEEREPFGRWLIAQKDRGDWIDALADAARKDPRFPKSGNPDDVRGHLNAMQAEGDMFEAVDDAEADWLAH